MFDTKSLVKSAIAPANRILAHARFVRCVKSTASHMPLKIEVGGHTAQRPGWLCTDISWRTRYYLDAVRAWPVPSGSASHVYADNVVEHIRMEPCRRMFREAHRVLSPGGRMRLATPDVEHVARMYLAQDGDARRQMAEWRRKGYEIHHTVDLLRTTFQDCGHHLGYLWDFDALRTELESAGFRNVQRCAPGQSDDPEFRNLGARPEWALIVETDARG